MSQQKNQKNIVVYNYDPHPKQQIEQPVNKQESIVDESPFNVSKILKAKQQHSNIFNLPQQDFSKVTPTQNPEKILPYDVFWWNSQNLKENKKNENQVIIPNIHLVQSRPQTATTQEQAPNFKQLTEDQFLELQQQQYQQFLQQKRQEQYQQQIQQQQVHQQQVQQQVQQSPNKQVQDPFHVIKQHNEMIETASFHKQQQEQRIQHSQEKKQLTNQSQVTNQLQNPAKVYDKINNPNVELKQRNPNFSDVFGNGLEKYYQQKPQQNSAKKQIEYMEESDLYGAKYHQRQMLKGMSSQMDTHKYYDQILDKQNQDQIKSKQPKSASHSPYRSPGKNLEQDEKLFPKPFYTELAIRGMGKEVNWEKLNTQLTSQQMLLADITVVQDKNGKIKQHKIIIKHYDATKLSIIKQWVLTQGGRLVEEKNLSSEEEFIKLMKLKEGPKQRPIRITEEKEKLKQQKKRPQSAAVVQKPKQKK